MKHITITDVSVKEGTNDKGPWANAFITDQDGQYWSVFDSKKVDVATILALRRGDVIAAELKMKDGEPIIKGGRISMASFTVFGKAAPGDAPPPPPAPGGKGAAWERDEALSRQDRLDQAREKNESIERQSGVATILAHYAALLERPTKPDDPIETYLADVKVAAARGVAWIASLYPGVPADSVDDAARAMAGMGEGRPADADTVDGRPDADRDFDAMARTSDNGVDAADVARKISERFGWSPGIFHQWLKGQGVPPVAGETVEEIVGNLPAGRVGVVTDALARPVGSRAGA